jgi:hypothetical protein
LRRAIASPATEGVVSAGLSFDNLWGGWFGGAKVRYFGPRPFIEDNTVRSKASIPVSARLGYKFDDGLIVRIDGLNLSNEQASQIDHFYGSRLASEPGEVEDIQLSPAGAQVVSAITDQAVVGVSNVA